MNNGAQSFATQSVGLDEGWSDFYALALLSEPSDTNSMGGNFAQGAYSGFLLDPNPQQPGPVNDQNYYYGLREYPYSTDKNKNPLTFKDIKIADNPYPSVPHNPAYAYGATGFYLLAQVWAVSLWEARTNLINKWQFDGGNQRILQLATDAMKYTPPEPNFVQARWAVIIADRVRYNGENNPELWAAFAKRGLGWSAKSPPSSDSDDVTEATDLPPAGTGGPWKNKGDFNLPADTFPDIVFQQGGLMKAWFMEASERKGEANISPNTDSSWFLKSSADINRDRKADLVFQDVNGFIAEWDMNGTTWIAANAFIPGHPGDGGWKLVATGDFNQDTKPDLVWQYEGGGSDGQIAVWYMDGITATGYTLTTPNALPAIRNGASLAQATSIATARRTLSFRVRLKPEQPGQWMERGRAKMKPTAA